MNKEEANKIIWSKIILALSIVFWILMLVCGVMGGVPIGNKLTFGNFFLRIIVTAFLMVLCGCLYMAVGFIAKSGLFPIYYGILKLFRRRTKIVEIKNIKWRLILGFMIWFQFCVYYMLAGPGSQLDFLEGKRILALPIGAIVAPIFGLVFWICWPIGKLMLYPFIFLNRHFFSK